MLGQKNVTYVAIIRAREPRTLAGGPQQHGAEMKTVISALVALVIGAGGMYFYQQGPMTQLKAAAATLETQLAEAKSAAEASAGEVAKLQEAGKSAAAELADAKSKLEASAAELTNAMEQKAKEIEQKAQEVTALQAKVTELEAALTAAKSAAGTAQ